MKQFRKCLGAILAVLMVASCFATWMIAAEEGTTVTPDADKPISFALKGTPTLDGTVDDMWKDVPATEVKSNDATKPSMTFKTMWDDNYVYVLYEVTDNDVISDENEYKQYNGGRWYGTDCAFFTFIPDYTMRGKAVQKIDTFYGLITANGRALDFATSAKGDKQVFMTDYRNKGLGSQKELAAEDGTKTPNLEFCKSGEDANYKTKITSTGYVVEARFDLKAYVQELDMKAGTCIGFDTSLMSTNASKHEYPAGSGSLGGRDDAIAWCNANTYQGGANSAKSGCIQLFDKKEDLPEYKPPVVDPPVIGDQTLDPIAPVSHAIKGTPTIDGTVDEIWNKAELCYMTQKQITNKNIPLPGARFRTMWDKDYLYVLVEVYDSTLVPETYEEQIGSAANIYKSDSVAFAMNVAYDRDPETAAENAANDNVARLMFGAYGTSANFLARDTKLFKDGDDNRYAITYQQDEEGKAYGYTFEIAFNLKALNSGVKMQEGTLVGMHVAINDADEFIGNRCHLINWYNGDGYYDSSMLGSVQFTNQTFDNSEEDLAFPEPMEDPNAGEEDPGNDEPIIVPGGDTNNNNNNNNGNNANTDKKPADDTTEAPEKPKKKGCKSAIGVASFAALGTVCVAALAFGTKKGKKED